MTESKNIAEFYNNYLNRLIRDFLKPNIRTENAISLSLKKIPKDVRSILDLGFGLGWSSFEIARHFTHADIKGFDISKELTKTANALFPADNLSYQSMDLTRNFPNGKFDAIILLDVFEHIPASKRDLFYRNIKHALTDNGRVIFTCPTVYHQKYLRDNKPEGLQPVDEDIDIEVILDFATKTETNLAHFEYLDIWNSRDYLFAVIERPYKYHTESVNQFIKTVDLLDFYSKYTLLKKSNLSNEIIPTLSHKQRLKHTLRSLLD
jgi:SAM-dependent methyltransferase